MGGGVKEAEWGGRGEGGRMRHEGMQALQIKLNSNPTRTLWRVPSL